MIATVVVVAAVACWAAVLAALAEARRAQRAAVRSVLASHGASHARRDVLTAEANVAAAVRVTRSLTGVDFAHGPVEASTVDVSERIRQDLQAAGATAQRINARSGSPRRSLHAVPDVFVKSNP